MIKNWREHLVQKRSEQCLQGTETILGLLQAMSIDVYVETGCGHLATFELYHSMLSSNGLAIGIDIRSYTTWSDYNPEHCPFRLLKGGLQQVDTVETLNKALDGRKIDFAFIDGDHNEMGVQKDWEAIWPNMRPGGLVVLHDYDPVALQRGHRDGQGAAILCEKLVASGHKIHSVETTAIGTAYLYK